MKTAISSLINPKIFIRLKDSTKAYFPGEVINGCVIIQSSKILEASCIKLEFRGRVLTNIKETKVSYICEQSIKLDEEPEFDPKEECQQFSFNLTLPTKNLISNCSLEHCSVSYKFKASVKSKSWFPGSILHKCSAKVNILDKIDIVDYLPPLIKPFSIEIKGYVKKSKKTGSAKVDVEIGDGAVLIGQSIPIRIFLEHFAPIKNLEGILIALYRKISTSSNNGKENSKLKIINTSTLPIFIDPKTLNAVISARIAIISGDNDVIITPTIKSDQKHLLVEYFIEIIVDLTIKRTTYESSGKSNFTTMTTSNYLKLKKKAGKYNLKFNIPIIIGTFNSNALGRRGGGGGNQNNQSLEVPIIIHSCYNSHPSHLSINSVRSLDSSLLVPTSSSLNNNDDVDDYGSGGLNNECAILCTGNVSSVPSAPSIEELGLYDDEFGLYLNSHPSDLSINSIQSFDSSILMPTSSSLNNNDDVGDNGSWRLNNGCVGLYTRNVSPVPSAPSIEEICVYDDELGLYLNSHPSDLSINNIQSFDPSLLMPTLSSLKNQDDVGDNGSGGWNNGRVGLYTRNVSTVPSAPSIEEMCACDDEFGLYFNSHSSDLSINSIQSFDSSILVPSSSLRNQDDVGDNGSGGLNNKDVILYSRNVSSVPSAPSIEELGVYDDEFGLYYSSEIIKN